MFKSAVAYYVNATKKPYTSFFDNLDLAVSLDVDNLPQGEVTNDIWLINKLVRELEKSGFTLNEMRINKDTVKAMYDNDNRTSAGEFFTQEIWCKFAREFLLDKHIPNWSEYNVWDNCCGTGNLMRTANHDVNKLFLSTLQGEDISIITSTPEYKGATVFQLDFLSELDVDVDNTFFVNKLPQRLQEILRNNEPLVIYVNPPYKSSSASLTDIGLHMQSVGLSASAYDLYFQFLYRFMTFVDIFNLTNLYICHFGPVSLFTGLGGYTLMQEFEKYFSFIDGFCVNAREFTDTSVAIPWAISCTLWKSRGNNQELEHKHAYLHKAIIITDEEGKKKVKVAEIPSLYDFTQQRLSHWAEDKDVVYYEQRPLMTSCCGFKGSTLHSNKAPRSAKMATNALGAIMAECTLKSAHERNAVFSCPPSVPFINITENNFWKCVAMYTVKSCNDNVDWSISKMELSAPDTTVEGYEEWVRNGLVLFLFDWKANMSSHRNVLLGDGEFATAIDFQNHFFPISIEEAREHCHDELILADMDKHPPQNEFILKQIEESKPYWIPEVREVFEHCKNIILDSYDKRKDGEYHGDTVSWDASLYQVKYLGEKGVLWSDETTKDLMKRLSAIKDILRKPCCKFGFMRGDESDI